MTPRQLQIARRLHHEAELLGAEGRVSVRVGDVRALLAALWFEIERANAAEDRLAGQKRFRPLAPLRVFAPEPTTADRPVGQASGEAPNGASAASAN